MLHRSASISAALLMALAGLAHAQTTVSLTGGRLTLTTNNMDQNVKVEMKEGPGLARVFGFQGIPDGTAYTGVAAVTVNTGSGRDQVQLDIQSSTGLDVRINTGAGDLESKVQWKLLPGAASASVVFTGSPSPVQKIEAEFDNESAGASINLDAGVAGEVTGKVLSDDLTSSLDVGFAARGAKTSFELTSNAASLDVRLRGTHAAAGSEVKHVIGQLRPASVRVSKDLTLSGGSDTLESKIAAPGSNVTLLGVVRAGGGDDRVLVESEGAGTVNGLRIEGGAGSDLLSNQTKGFFQLSQTVGASIFGGPGDDILILTTDTAIRGTGLPNDVQAIIDGGDGFDLFNAFGLIRNCEGRL